MPDNTVRVWLEVPEGIDRDALYERVRRSLWEELGNYGALIQVMHNWPPREIKIVGNAENVVHFAAELMRRAEKENNKYVGKGIAAFVAKFALEYVGERDWNKMEKELEKYGPTEKKSL